MQVLGDSPELSTLKEGWKGRFEEKVRGNTVVEEEEMIDSEEFCKMWNACVTIQRAWKTHWSVFY